MANRSLRFMDHNKPFYAAKNFKKDSKRYERGHLFDKRDVTNRILARLFQTGYIIHGNDFSKEEQERFGIVSVEVEQPAEETNKEVSDKATVIKDDEDAFIVSYQGVEFEVSRNQVRDDGTLTPGGMKAFKQASE